VQWKRAIGTLAEETHSNQLASADSQLFVSPAAIHEMGSIKLNIEPEQYNISIVYYVILAFEVDLAGLMRSGH